MVHHFLYILYIHGNRQCTLFSGKPLSAKNTTKKRMYSLMQYVHLMFWIWSYVASVWHIMRCFIFKGREVLGSKTYMNWYFAWNAVGVVLIIATFFEFCSLNIRNDFMNGTNLNYMWLTSAFSGNIWPIQSVTEVYILTSALPDDLTALLGQYRSRKSSSDI